jgi:hypothetical protein
MTKLLRRRYGKTNSGNRNNRTLTEMAQIAADADESIECHIHQSAALETMREERTSGVALWAAVGAIAIEITNFFRVLLDRATEAV